MKLERSKCRTNTQDCLRSIINVVLKGKVSSVRTAPADVQAGTSAAGLNEIFYFLNVRIQNSPWGAFLPWHEPATTACDANTDTPLCKMKTQAHVIINEKMVRTLGWRQQTLTDEQVSGMPAHPWCPNISAHTPWCMVVQRYADAMTHKHLRLVLIAMARSLTHTWIMCHGIFEWKSAAITKIKCGCYKGHASQPFLGAKQQLHTFYIDSVSILYILPLFTWIVEHYKTPWGSFFSFLL